MFLEIFAKQSAAADSVQWSGQGRHTAPASHHRKRRGRRRFVYGELGQAAVAAALDAYGAQESAEVRPVVAAHAGPAARRPAAAAAAESLFQRR